MTHALKVMCFVLTKSANRRKLAPNYTTQKPRATAVMVEWNLRKGRASPGMAAMCVSLLMRARSFEPVMLALDGFFMVA